MTYNNSIFFFVVAPPASEPITLSEAKLYLRVDGSGEDTLIASMITAARMAAEHYLRRSLITQSRRISYDNYAPACIELVFGPVQSVSSVKLITRIGAETVIDSNYYHLTAGNEKLLMDSALMADRVEVTYSAGYGNAAAVPEAIKQGILAHLAVIYEDRGSGAVLPGVAQALYQPYRRMKI